jgi:hypothetical protein
VGPAPSIIKHHQASSSIIKHHQASSNIAKHEDDDTTKRMPTTNEKAVTVGKQEGKDRSDTS